MWYLYVGLIFALSIFPLNVYTEGALLSDENGEPDSMPEVAWQIVCMIAFWPMIFFIIAWMFYEEWF